MPAFTEEHLKALAPYVAGGRPDERGEVEMYCPIHDDAKRSASLNVKMGVWYCHAGCGGGSIRQLVEDGRDRFVPPEGRVTQARPSARPSTRSVLPAKKNVRRWHRRLMEDAEAQTRLLRTRGITVKTMRRARIGWDGKWYKIPVWGPDRELWNVRTYDPAAAGTDRRKIWGVRGMNHPRLFPISSVLKAEPGDPIIICEGEWDALLALQTGYLAITRTGAAKVWRPDWSDYFRDLRVFICHDQDLMGDEANNRVGEALERTAREVRYVDLPYHMREKNGKDLTDFILDNPEDPSLALGFLLEQSTTKEGR